MTPQQKLIGRLCAVFGEPRSDNVDLFVRELERSLKPFSADVLQKTCDEIVDTSQFWPRPYEIRAVATRIGTDKFRAEHPQKEPEKPWIEPDPESKARVAAMRQQFIDNMKEFADKHVSSDTIKPTAKNRDYFEGRKSPLGWTWSAPTLAEHIARQDAAKHHGGE